MTQEGLEEGVYEISVGTAGCRSARRSARGKAREKRVTANKMLGEHLPLDLISRVTGLSIEEINRL